MMNNYEADNEAMAKPIPMMTDEEKARLKELTKIGFEHPDARRKSKQGCLWTIEEHLPDDAMREEFLALRKKEAAAFHAQFAEAKRLKELQRAETRRARSRRKAA